MRRILLGLSCYLCLVRFVGGLLASSRPARLLSNTRSISSTAARRRPSDDYHYEGNDDIDYRYAEDDDVYEDSSEVGDRYYYPEERAAAPLARPRRRQVEPVDDGDWYDNEEDEEYDDYEENDLPDEGNFWSNPKPGFDAPLHEVPSRRRPRADGNRRRQRRSLRTGTPPPPEPFVDLYNRLFWYGFDPSAEDDNTPDADRTMFGGTKGKFNGLAYLGQDPRIPRRRLRQDTKDYDDEDPDEEDEPRRDWPVTPPYDPPYPRRSAPTRVSSQRPSRRKTRKEEEWASDNLSNWFSDDDENDYEERVAPRRRQRRSQQRDPWNVLDTFFGLNRGDLDEQAELYTKQLGVSEYESRRGDQRRRSPNPRPRREPDSFNEEENEVDTIWDVDMVELNDEIIDAEAVVDEKEEPRVELEWEERSLAFERIPPADIPAWGPKGELDIDARTKAIEDALEDIGGARKRVSDAEKKADEAKEEVSILRIDAELERKRLKNMRMDPRAVQQKIRRINQKVESAARAFRYSNMRTQSARDALIDLEKRHWAVLSLYSADKAEEEVSLALEELYEAEPAARRAREKLFGSRERKGSGAEAVDDATKEETE